MYGSLPHMSTNCGQWSYYSIGYADELATVSRILASEERRPFALMRSLYAYCAGVHLSEPVNFTATSEMKMCRGFPSAVPRCSVEMRRGPAFLYPVQVAFTRLGFLSPPCWNTRY